MLPEALSCRFIKIFFWLQLCLYFISFVMLFDCFLSVSLSFTKKLNNKIKLGRGEPWILSILKGEAQINWPETLCGMGKACWMVHFVSIWYDGELAISVSLSLPISVDPFSHAGKFPLQNNIPVFRLGAVILAFLIWEAY